MRNTLRAWRSMSSAPMYTTHSSPKSAAAGRRGNAVLSGARLGDHPGLAQALREQALAEDVVDLVGAGVRKILALDPHGCADALANRSARYIGVGRPA